MRHSGFMSGKAVTAVVARPAVSARRLAAPIMATFAKTADVDGAKFGAHVFRGWVADKYLKKHGESAKLLETSAWTEKKADAVAAALLDWARDNQASSYCHWFQPMGSSGFRHGQSGQVIPSLQTCKCPGRLPCAGRQPSPIGASGSWHACL